MRIAILTAVTIAASLVACQSQEYSAESEIEPAEPETTAVDGWISLAADQWRGYQQDSLPSAWAVLEDGTLYFSQGGGRGDIVTRGQYDNFELELEWKIAEGGNSGIMFRVSEDHDYPWRTGPEFQILDDENHPDAQEGGDRLAGANYDMHAPSAQVAKPVGEWNSVRIVVNGATVEHWMNGERIVAYELWSEDWKERIAGSKWIDMPDYGMMQSGHICLQDHGDPVWFRNIRIRPLLPADA